MHDDKHSRPGAGVADSGVVDLADSSGEGNIAANGSNDSRPTRTSNKLLVFSKHKYASLRTRTVSALVLVCSFAGAIYLGHAWLTLYAVGVQTVIVHELFTLARRNPNRRDQDQVEEWKYLPWFRSLNWYFYVALLYFQYGRFARQHFSLPDETSLSEYALVPGRYAHILHDAVLHTLRHHSFYSYLMYIGGWVWFVLSLKKGMYGYQFSQFAWTHMILALAVVQSSFLVANIFEGMIWFLLPCSLVIVNDIMAYFCGFFFGRTPLLALSPKKTWEGFLGAIVFTVLWGFFASRAMAKHSYMTCPQTELTFSLTGESLSCEQIPTFTDVEYAVPEGVRALCGHLLWIPAFASSEVIRVMPVQLHATVLASFASIVAPFGGFFASGFKRAMKVKDFSDTIPGHGGFTDRMDCQITMGLFAYMYCATFVSTISLDVRQVLQVVLLMDEETRMEVWRQLTKELVAQRLLPEESLELTS